MKCYIYILIDPTTNEVRYVGKTNDVAKRFQSHLKEAKKQRTHKEKWINSLLSKDLQPILEVVESVQSDTWAFWEMHYISLYKSWGFKLTNGTAGGDCGPTFNELTLEKQFGRIQKLKKRFAGKPRSQEVKDKLKEAARVRKQAGKYKHTTVSRKKLSKVKLGKATHQSKKIVQLDLKNNLIKIWSYPEQAARELGISSQGIRKCCKGGIKSSQGFIWQYI